MEHVCVAVAYKPYYTGRAVLSAVFYAVYAAWQFSMNMATGYGTGRVTTGTASARGPSAFAAGSRAVVMTGGSFVEQASEKKLY